MANNAVPLQAAENPPSIVVLGGREHEFREPGRRRAMEIFSRGMELVQKYGLCAVDDKGALTIAVQVQDPINGLIAVTKLVPELLDFLYDALALPKAERLRIDDEFDGIPEVMAAFTAVLERLQAPFAGGLRGSAPETTEN